PSSSNFFLAFWRNPIADSTVARSDVFLRLTPAVMVRILKRCVLSLTIRFETSGELTLLYFSSFAFAPMPSDATKATEKILSRIERIEVGLLIDRSPENNKRL